MADKTIVMTVTADEVLLDANIDAVARNKGWDETSEITKLKTIENAIRKFLEDEAKIYFVRTASEQAVNAAEAQFNAAKDGITLVVTET
jgi:hypothetical protein